MRSSSEGAIPSDLGVLIDRLDDYERRLRTLEAPSGESLTSTVAKLTALIADIQAQLDAWTASRWTNAQIDTRISAPPYSVAVGGNLSATGTLGVSGQATVGGALFVPDAYGFDITYTRRTAWWGNDGRAGYASSSRDKKTSIKPADEKALLALLDVEIFDFVYRAEVARRTSLRINDGVDYVPARELGLMAQDLDAAGLGFFVYHDENGNAEGIEYGMLTVALLAIARAQDARLTALEAKVG